MHKFLRQELKGYKSLLWIVFFAIGAQYLLIRIPRGHRETIVASVNGVPISAHEFNQQARKLQALMARYSGGKNNQIALDMLLQRVAKESLLVQNAEKNGFAVGKESLSQEVFSMLPPHCFKADGTLNMEAYQQVLQSRGDTIHTFEREQEHRIKLGSFQELLAESVAIPDWLGEFNKEHRENKRKYHILSIPFDEIERTLEKKEISDEELKSYFQAHQEEYRSVETKKVRYFAVSYEDFKKNTSFSDEELEAYYHKNKHRLFTDRPEVSIRQIVFNKVKNKTDVAIEAKKRAEAALGILKAEPGQFEALAKKESDDLETAKKGGFYGVIKKDVLPGAVERAAYRLRAEGDVSGLLDTKEAYVIIQLVKRMEQEAKSFASVRSEIIESLKKEQVDRRLIAQMRSFVRAARQDAAALEAASQEFGGSWKEVSLSSVDQFKDDEVMQSLKQAAFAKGIKKGSVSSASSKKGALLFEVLDVIAPAIPSFKEVKEDVLYNYRALTAKKEAKNIARELHKKILAGEALHALGYKVIESSFVDEVALRKESKKYPGLKKEVLLLDNSKQVLRSHDEQAYYLIQLAEVSEKEASKPSVKRKSSLALMQEERKRMTQEAFIAYLEKNATIVYNNKVLHP